MATKTRLGRDPLAGTAATTKAKHPSAAAPKKAAAKAGTSKTTASGRGKPKPATAKPDAAPDQPVASAPLTVEGHTAVAPAAVTPAIAATLPVAAEQASPDPGAAPVAAPWPRATPTDAVPEAVEPAAAALAPLATVTPSNAPEGQADQAPIPAPTGTVATGNAPVDAPANAPADTSTNTSTVASADAPLDAVTDAPAEAIAEPAPPTDAAPRPTPVPEAAAPAPCPAAPILRDAAIPEATSANARAVGEVHAVVSATAAPTPGGPHPAEVFLRGVLEGLTQAGSLRIAVAVDPQTYALPVEKLFYFSHVLQLLVAPMETPTDSWRRPGDGGGPVAALTVTLSPVGGGRHRLRAYDNGLFFRSYLPKIALNQETLRPLLLFVVNRDGSIRLKQGRAVEFEITG
ncbi:MAG: hypothetical protein ACP59X_11650 [Solidesulfovibrio sp. DCME]|uniref:hypothetical protein n=1 Tax=Solidesulfovibrio sp. DCME TaxID=3447380 RepID=UPI003D0E2BE5